MSEVQAIFVLILIVVPIVAFIWFVWRDAQRQAKAQRWWVKPKTMAQRVVDMKASAKEAGSQAAGCAGCLVALVGLFLAALAVMAVIKWMWNLV